MGAGWLRYFERESETMVEVYLIAYPWLHSEGLRLTTLARSAVPFFLDEGFLGKVVWAFRGMVSLNSAMSETAL